MPCWLKEVLRAKRSVGAGLCSVSSHIREYGWDCVVGDLKALEDRLTPARLCMRLLSTIKTAIQLLLFLHGHVSRVLENFLRVHFS